MSEGAQESRGERTGIPTTLMQCVTNCASTTQGPGESHPEPGHMSRAKAVHIQKRLRTIKQNAAKTRRGPAWLRQRQAPGSRGRKSFLETSLTHIPYCQLPAPASQDGRRQVLRMPDLPRQSFAATLTVLAQRVGRRTLPVPT